MARLKKCLSCKLKDLSLIPRTHGLFVVCFKARVAAHTYNPSAREQKQVDPLGLLAGQPT